MKILHLGSSGMIGKRILAEAARRKHTVVATSRHPENIDDHPGVTSRALQADDADALIAIIQEMGADVLISSVSPRSTGNPTREALGVVNAIIKAADKTGIRAVVVGGAGSLTMPDGTELAETLPDTIRPEAIAMREVRNALRDSNINWTCICPPAEIAPGNHTKVFRLGGTGFPVDENGKSRISCEDFSHALLDEVEQSKHEGKQISVSY